MWEQLSVGRIGDTVEMNVDSLFPEFRAHVNDLNSSAALDWHASGYFDSEPRNCNPAVSMLNAIRLDRSVERSWQQPLKRDTHWCISSLKFGGPDELTTDFDLEMHTGGAESQRGKLPFCVLQVTSDKRKLVVVVNRP